MQRLQGLHGLRSAPRHGVITIGNFDGVHLAHQQLLGVAARRAANASPAAPVIAITFEPHPLTVLRPADAPPRLTPAQIKRQLLAHAGVDVLIELPPSPDVLGLSAAEFFAELKDHLAPRHFVEGPNFNFGRGRDGNVAALARWSADAGIGIDIIEPIDAALLDLQRVAVSSSLLRVLVATGRPRDAAILMGRPYRLLGTVVAGHQRGRTIGFPTANLDIADQLAPLPGVYAASAIIDNTPRPAALSVGFNPTFGDNKSTLEAHILDFDRDLYGQTLAIDVHDFIRDSRRFPSVAHLVQQIQRDVAGVRSRLDLPAPPWAGTLSPLATGLP